MTIGSAQPGKRIPDPTLDQGDKVARGNGNFILQSDTPGEKLGEKLPRFPMPKP